MCAPRDPNRPCPWPGPRRGGHQLRTRANLCARRAADPADRARWEAWREERIGLWADLARTLDTAAIDRVRTATIGLAELPAYAPKILRGDVAGRVLVDCAKCDYY